MASWEKGRQVRGQEGKVTLEVKKVQQQLPKKGRRLLKRMRQMDFLKVQAPADCSSWE